jgi:hypothetical protein
LTELASKRRDTAVPGCYTPAANRDNPANGIVLQTNTSPVIDVVTGRRGGDGFRVEAFNVFNWFNGGQPNTNRSAGTFGLITTAGAPRILQFAVKYAF